MKILIQTIFQNKSYRWPSASGKQWKLPFKNIKVFSEKTDVPSPAKPFYGGNFNHDLLWPWKCVHTITHYELFVLSQWYPCKYGSIPSLVPVIYTDSRQAILLLKFGNYVPLWPWIRSRLPKPNQLFLNKKPICITLHRFPNSLYKADL